ncbi:MAG TPA: tetratricopeptide repeat protein, partial [Aggregatilineales bacterium]|nr:tetratricopeptide repeat protein [Aggregatilineales bacterium]HQE20047.1 tetratricopeptide repeat protein [Aggregatilineales bacterium]
QGDLTFRRLLAEFYVDEGYRVGDQGLPLLMTLAEQAPGDAEIRAALGWAHFLVGDVEAAFTHVDEALQLDENSVRANAHKAALLDSQGRLDEAAVYYRRALELDPDGPFGALARRALERIGARIP